MPEREKQARHGFRGFPGHYVGSAPPAAIERHDGVVMRDIRLDRVFDQMARCLSAGAVGSNVTAPEVVDAIIDVVSEFDVEPLEAAGTSRAPGAR